MTPQYKPLTFNYIRVSTVIQNTERQLLDVPCDREFVDKASGKDTNRPAYKEMISLLRPGDTVNVHSLDRAGRNTADILNIVQEIKEKGCSIRFHKENLFFDGAKSDLYSDLMLTILSAFATFERQIILERQREGIAIAKEKGKFKGRQPKIKDDQIALIKADFDSGIAKTKIAEKFGITRSYVYQVVKASQLIGNPLGALWKVKPKAKIELIEKLNVGASVSALARDYGVSGYCDWFRDAA